MRNLVLTLGRALVALSLVVIAVVLQPPTGAGAAVSLSVDVRVSASGDDVEESDSGSMGFTSSDLELVDGGRRGDQFVGMRFTGVGIPRGSSIEAAYLQFQTDEVSSDPTSLTITAQAVDDAPAFSGVDFDLSSRPTTVASVDWNPAPWTTVGESGPDQQTPSLTTVIQELVDRPGWSSGNSIVVIVSGSGKRVAESYDGVSSAAPLLHVDYSTAVSVEAVDDIAVEGSDSGRFLFSRSGPTDTPLTVTYDVAGSATGGADYSSLSGVVEIPTGLTSVEVVVTPVADSEVEGTETVVATVVDGPGYRAGSKRSATVTILDANTPTVSVEVADGISTEGVDPVDSAEFTVTRTGPTAEEIVVAYSMAGSAIPGVDYVAPPGLVTIPAGASSASVQITPLDDPASEAPESLLLTITESSGYAVGTPDMASATIIDNDPIVEIRVSASSDDAEEEPNGNVSRTSSDLDMVDIQSGGSHVVGIRFAAGVPPGAEITNAWIQFQANEENTETASLTIDGDASDDAAPFTDTPFGISSRPRTTSSVPWSPAPWPTSRVAGPDQRTPDLSAVIQEIVDRPGWSAGNSIVLIVSGSGLRVADAFDGDPAAAPLLHLEYEGSGAPPNQPPTVTASADSAVFPDPAVLGGSVADDQLPNPPGALSATWTQVGGPGVVTFADPGAIHTTATFSQPGVYELQLSVDDGELAASDTVWLTAVDATAAQPGELRAGVLGDFGAGCCAEADVATMLQNLAPDIIVTTGDNRYVNDVDYAVGQFYSDYIGNYQGTYGPGSAINRFFPALGNHDYSEFGGVAPHLDYFSLPGGAIETTGSSLNERYYDFVQGPVHFFVLNSNDEEPDGISATSAQAQWLQTQLASSEAPWQVVVMHHPPYSSGPRHGPELTMRWPFDAWGADAVLAGHEHAYERIVKGSLPYLVVGTGGAGLSVGTPTFDPDSQYYYGAGHGALIIEACAMSLDFEFHSVTEGLLDSFSVGAGSCAGGSPPAAEDDSFSTAEDTAVSVNVVDNDTDPDGDLDSASVSITIQPADGTAVPNGDGTVTYTPGPDFNGTDSFAYEVCDTGGLCDTATVTMTVDPVPDPPVAVADAATTSENSAVVVGVLGNDTDPDGDLDPTTVAVTTPPSLGSAQPQSDGSVTYTPNPDTVGTDAFTYEVCDLTALCDTASVSITIGAANDPPTANDDTVQTDEDTSLLIDPVANDVDPDGNLDSTSLSITSQPADGTAAPNGDGTVTYTPGPDFNGIDSFVYEVCDTGGLCDTATVTITVNAINDPPMANDDSATTAEDTAVNIAVLGNDTDVDDPVLTVTNLAQPANGTVTLQPDSTVSYSPDPAYTGTDTFSYTANDGTVDSVPAVVSVTVLPSEPPVSTIIDVRITAGTDDAEERSTGSVRLGSSDLELVQDKSNLQTVGLRFPGLQIPPGATIIDAWVQFQTDEVSTGPSDLVIRAQAGDDAPTFASTSGDISSRPLTAAATTWDQIDPWSVVGEAGDAQRTPSLTLPIQEVIDRPGWVAGNALALVISGTGTRIAEAQDGDPSAAPLLHVEFSTGPVANRPPTAVDDAFSAVEGVESSIDVVSNDFDPDQNLDPSTTTTSCSGCFLPNHGPLVNDGDGTFRYTPDIGTAGNGSDTFRYQVCDADGLCDTATVTITIVSANAPTVVESRVAASADDAEERPSGSVSLRSSDLELIQDKSNAQTVGVRFAGLAVPQGATISAAWIQFQTDETSNEPTDLTIRAHAADDASTFQNTSGDISSRPTTTAFQLWSPPAWDTPGEAGSDQRTPDLNTLVQEIVDRPGWAGGNALVIIFTGTGSRVAESYDGFQSGAPLLHIEYTTP